MNLATRIAKLEEKSPDPQKQGRAFRIIAGKGDEGGVLRLLQAEGYDADAGDMAIIHYIVSPAGREPWSGPPYVVRS